MKKIVINTPYQDKENTNESSDKAIQTIDHESTLFEKSIKTNEKLLIDISKKITISNRIYADANRLIWNVCLTITIGIILLSIFILMFLIIYCYKNFGSKYN